MPTDPRAGRARDAGTTAVRSAAAEASTRRGTRLRRFGWALATALALVLLAAAVMPRTPLEPALPAPATWFNDNAQLVSKTFASNMNLRLPIERHAQVVVVVDPGAPANVDDYTARSAQDWRIGARGVDNGIVLFVFPALRTARLEIGYGLEGVLTDVDAKRMLDDKLLPAFAGGRYEDGIESFLAALFKWLEDDTHQARLHALNFGFVDALNAALRQIPRYARNGWTMFATGDFELRAVVAVLSAVFVAVVGPFLLGVLSGMLALVQLPWRLMNSVALRNLDKAQVAREWTPAAFMRRPPPSLMAVADDLALPAIVYGGMCALGIVAVVLIGGGTDLLVGARGQFGGGGVTLIWPAVG